MVRYHGGHDTGRRPGVLPVELHVERQLCGPVECAPVELWRRCECRERLAVMPPVVGDVGLNESHERVNRCLDCSALSRQIVLQSPGGPGAMCFWEDDDSETAGRHAEHIGTTAEINSGLVSGSA